MLLANLSYAQNRRVLNLPTYDKQIIHFGFILGVNSYNFIAKPIRDFRLVDSLMVIEPIPAPGFTLGIVSNLHLGDNFDLRFLPQLTFAERTLQYSIRTTKNGQTSIKQFDKKVESTLLELPVLFKFKSARVNNARAYLIGGAKYAIDLASQKDVNDKGEKLIKLKKNDIVFELGFGLDFYLEYFKFSPEIKMSYGINDLLIREGNIFTDPLSRLTSKAFYFSFYFE